jgi:hypothetical protein
MFDGQHRDVGHGAHEGDPTGGHRPDCLAGRGGQINPAMASPIGMGGWIEGAHK